MGNSNRSTGLTRTLGTITAAILLCSCGGGSNDNSVKHLTNVADPDPQTPFFDDDAVASFANDYSDSVSNWYADLSKVLPSDVTSFNSGRTRTIMSVTRNSAACDSGSVTTSMDSSTGSAQNFTASVAFNNCNNAGVVSNGSVSMRGSADGLIDSDYGTGEFSVEVNNLSIRGQEAATINGDVNASVTNSADLFSFNLSGTAMTTVSAGETTTYRNYQLAVMDNTATDTTTLSASLTIHNTRHGSIVLRTDVPLTGSNSEDNPSSGKMTLTHSDGSYLIVNADNGDPETFAYTVFNGSSTISGNRSWTELELFE